MENQRVGRRLELEYLLKLYKFYEDNYYYLQFNDEFKKVMEAQETKIAYIYRKFIKDEE